MLVLSFVAIIAAADSTAAWAKESWCKHLFAPKEYARQLRHTTLTGNTQIETRKAVARVFINNNIHSIGNYMNWLKKNIHYASDRNGDQWATPQETLAKGAGDCEDLAFLNTAAMSLFGHEAVTLAMLDPSKQSHAISVFKKEPRGCYYIFDNMRVRSTGAKTIRDLANYIFAGNRDCLYLAKMNLEEKQSEILFKAAQYSSVRDTSALFVLAIGTIRMHSIMSDN